MRGVGTIEQEITSQPQIWRSAAAAAMEVADQLPSPGGRLGVIGCGTSYFVGQAVAALWESGAGAESDAFPASEMPSERAYDAVLAISRSGTTTEVLRALDRLRPDVPTVAICAVADTPVAHAAHRRVILEFADEQAIVQTRFATAVLALIRAHVGGDVEQLSREGEQALAAPLPEALCDFDQFVFLGSGWGVGLANEAALKMREAAGAWSESYPAMEYRHGPVSATRPTTLVWAIGSVERDVLESATEAGATVVDSGRDPMAELILVHRAAVALARDRGLDPSRPRHLTRSVVLSSDGGP
jgi:fructoselysine-6-P-deglycase FrlB-like protein